MLGLPDSVAGCLFDLDGVLTQTAKIHAAAWKAMFDQYLRSRAAVAHTDYVPFDPVADYNRYVVRGWRGGARKCRSTDRDRVL